MAKAVRTEQVVAKQEKLVHEQPVRIEPAITVVPKSERVEKEKQQSLFFAPPPGAEGDLPAISLLDPPPPNQETVSAETIEFTSRLIEKKLADFGVSVTVVAAQAALSSRATKSSRPLASRVARSSTWPRTWRARSAWSAYGWWKPYPART